MATYNGEKYLSKQLDSILHQSFSIDEIVIVDDCSTDSTLSLLRDYASRFANIKVFTNKVNLGVRKSFERALSLTQGDYIALSDQDDVWLPNKIETLLANIGDSLLVHSDSMIVDQNLKIIASSHFAISKKLHKESFIDYLLNSNITGCTMLLSRKLLDSCLPFTTYNLPHDWYIAYYAAYKNSIKFVDKPLMYYRQHQNNVSGIAKKSYEEYIASNHEIGLGIMEILQDPYFNNDQDAIFMVAYKKSIWQKEYLSFSNLYYLITKKTAGLKLLLFYLIMVVPPKQISKMLYNFVRKFI